MSVLQFLKVRVGVHDEPPPPPGTRSTAEKGCLARNWQVNSCAHLPFRRVTPIGRASAGALWLTHVLSTTGCGGAGVR